MFPISMLKFTDKFEFNKGISINEGGATINGGLTVNPGTMSYINGGLTVQNGLTVNNGLTVTNGTMSYFNGGLTLNSGLTITGGGATINGGLTVNPGTMSYINGGLTVQNGGIKTENGWSDIKGLKVYDNFSLHGIIANLGLGFNARSGTGGVTTGHVINFDWSDNKGYLWVDNLRQGFLSCDYRLKENIQSPSSVLERLCSLNMFNYELKDISIFKKNGTHLGVYAHELQDAFPELHNIVNGEKDELTTDGNIQPQSINPEFTNLLLKGLQELNAKVVELENKIIELENKS